MFGRRLFAVMIAIFAGWGGASALAQPEDLTRGKSPAQLFASDCADCHRSPRGLAKSDARSLAGFLRVHYTASKESAAAIAEYLVSLRADPRPARPAAPRPAPSAAKPPQEQSAAPAGKPSESGVAKPAETAREPKPVTPAAAPSASPQ